MEIGSKVKIYSKNNVYEYGTISDLMENFSYDLIEIGLDGGIYDVHYTRNGQNEWVSLRQENPDSKDFFYQCRDMLDNLVKQIEYRDMLDYARYAWVRGMEEG
jgi:hypothetical protein